ncbi:MAG TPA: ArgE/DapE family deacylase [Firmicutes bacterium]|nr:ArgE/DapE family deacylase [Bacillota bacterium]
MLKVLQDLISIDSVNPELVSGHAGEAEAARYLAGVLSDMGLEVRLQEIIPGRPNVIGIARGSDPLRYRSIMFNGHLDTVGVERVESPFTPRLEDGKVFGRGAQDMKGGLAAMAGAIQSIVSSGERHGGDIIFAGVVDEEYKSAGSEGLIRDYKADGAVVCEPTELNVAIAHKGFCWIKVTTNGRAAHGSRPEEGLDAIAAMGTFLSCMGRYEKEVLSKRRHIWLGSPSVHASLISGGRELSSYPDRCELHLERRTLPGETEDQVQQEMLELLGEAACRHWTAFNGNVETYFYREAFEVSPEEDIVKTLSRAFQQVTGLRAELGGFSAWTDAAILRRAGIPTVVFGPGGGGLHGLIEYCDVEQLVTATDVLAKAALDFTNTAK